MRNPIRSAVKAVKRRQASRAAAAAMRVRLGELGALYRQGVFEEYNAELKPPDCYPIFDKMQRGDGQVQAVELAISLPIESLNYYIEPASDGTLDKKIAANVESNLMEGMTSTWGSVVTEALSGVMQGVNVLEEVWESRDGMIWLRKLAPRPPYTIVKWEKDEKGGIQGIWQRTSSTDPKGVLIPIEKLLRFTWRERAGDPAGRAVLRPMYKHWFVKDTLYKISNIGMERFFVGIPIGVLPHGATDDDKQAYRAILESLRAAHGGALVLPPGYEKPELLEGNQRTPDILSLINHHDLLMARAGLVQFLNLGSSDVGSWALSDSHVTFFLLAEKKIADWICEIINRYLIPQMVTFNHPGYDQFPKLAHSSVQHVLQKAALADALQKLVQGQLITPDGEVEDTLRELLDLPPRPEEEEEPEGPETVPQEEKKAERQRTALRAARRRPRRPRDQKQLARDKRRLESLQAEFQKDMKAIVERQHDELMKRLDPMIDAYLKADPIARGKHIARMKEVTVPLVGRYRNLLAEWMRRLYTEARDKAARDLKIEVPESISNEMRSYMATKADTIAELHAAQLKFAVVASVIESARKELSKKQVVANAMQAARERSGRQLYDGLKEAGQDLIAELELMLASFLPAEPNGATESPETISGGEG